MTLAKPLREVIALVDFAKQREEMGFALGLPSLHQAITGPPGSGTLEQAKEYARELIQRRILKNTPVEMNCNQPMSDAMVQQFFKDAKKGMLIVDGIEHLARQETFTSLALRAASEGSCIIVMCGAKETLQRWFAEDPGWERRFPYVFDMADPAIAGDLADQVKLQDAARIEEMLTVQNPIQPMRPLRLVPKQDK
jgi:hypothetical protein